MLLAAPFALRFTIVFPHPNKHIKYAMMASGGGGKDFNKAHDLVGQQRR